MENKSWVWIVLALTALAVYVIAEGAVTTQSGDLTLKPASRKVFVDGVVGVGTASPYYTLTVKDSSTTGSAIGEFLNGNNEGVFIGHTGSNSYPWSNVPANTLVISADYHGLASYRDLALLTGNNPRIFIKKDGSIGMGTTNPSYKMHLYDSNHIAHMVEANGNKEATLYLKNDYGRWGIIVNDDWSGPLQFYRTAGTQGSSGYMMTIDKDGKVGVGTTEPNAKLHVKDGLIQIESTSSTAQLSLKADTGRTFNIGSEYSPYNRFIIWDNTASAYRMVIDSNGKIGVGTEYPSEKLDVDGNIRASGKVKLRRPDGNFACCGPDNANQWVCGSC